MPTATVIRVVSALANTGEHPFPFGCGADRAEARTGGAARRAGPPVSSAPDYELGQLWSMFFSAVLMSSWPLIQETSSFQNEPAPTWAGIASEPSKRKVLAPYRYFAIVLVTSFG